MQQFTDTVSDEDTFDSDGDGVCPFQSFVEQLLLDMFDPGKWLWNLTNLPFVCFFQTNHHLYGFF